MIYDTHPECNNINIICGILFMTYMIYGQFCVGFLKYQEEYKKQNVHLCMCVRMDFCCCVLWVHMNGKKSYDHCNFEDHFHKVSQSNHLCWQCKLHGYNRRKLISARGLIYCCNQSSFSSSTETKHSGNT